MIKSTIALFSVVFFSLISLTNSLSAESCACVEQHGYCTCPQGECACMQHGQTCECVPQSEECVLENACEITPLPQHQISLGAEIFQAHRKKELTNAKQNGWNYGGRLGYERIKRYKIYWGVDGLYSAGHLKGHFQGIHSKLRFTNANVEGRIGYTIQKKDGYLPTLIPFVGYGYYQEISKFERPRDRHHKAKTSFDYFAVGFLSEIYPHRKWVVGLNFKARIQFNSNCKISDDPFVDNFTQHFEQHVQYRVELPVTYRVSGTCDHLAIRLTPFYENRHYGEQKNFPYDFLDTKFNIYGFNLSLMATF